MRISLFCAGIVCLVGCAATPHNHYYVLSPMPDPGNFVSTHFEPTGVSVRLPGMLDRNQIVVRNDAQSVDIREFDRWAEPLDQMVPRILGADLAARQRLSAKGLLGHISVTIDEFMAGPGEAVHLTGSWAPTADDPKIVQQATAFDLSQPLATEDSADIAAAMSHLLGTLSAKIVPSG